MVMVKGDGEDDGSDSGDEEPTTTTAPTTVVLVFNIGIWRTVLVNYQTKTVTSCFRFTEKV